MLGRYNGTFNERACKGGNKTLLSHPMKHIHLLRLAVSTEYIYIHIIYNFMCTLTTNPARSPALNWRYVLAARTYMYSGYFVLFLEHHK